MSHTEEFAELKRVVASILLSTPHGRTQRELLNDYEFLVGRGFPYRAFGFKTLLECVEAMHVARIERNGLDCVLYGIGSESTKHIEKLVHRQRSVPPKGRAKGGTQCAPKGIPEIFKARLRELMLSYPNGLQTDQFSEAYSKRFGGYANYRSWGFKTLNDVLNEVPTIVSCQYDRTKNKYIIRGNGTVAPRHMKSLLDNKRLNGSSLNALDVTPDKICNEASTKSSITIDVNRNVKELLANKSGGVWASSFEMEYKAFTGEDLPWKDMGYPSITDFLSSLKGGCRIEKPFAASTDCLVLAGEKESSSNKVKTVNQDTGVSEELSLTISQIVSQYKKGIPLSDFAEVFKERCGRDLPVLEDGFCSVAEMLSHVPGVIVTKPATSSAVMVLSVARSDEEEGVTTVPVTNSAGGHDEAVKISLPKVIPQSCITYDHVATSYTRLAYPTGDTHPVYISYVKSPSCMYLQLIGESTTKVFESLSEEIFAFYSSKEGSTRIIGDLKIGQACCTVYPEDCYWYRAEVVDVPEPDIVMVKYVDYGNTGLVPRTSLRHPKPHHLALPAQALECRLANIKPPGSKWSQRATLLLATMTKDKPLIAMILSANKGVASVCLCDTNTDKDIHINDVLVSQGLAIFSPDTVADVAGFDAIDTQPLPPETSEDASKIRMPSTIGHGGGISTTTCIPNISTVAPGHVYQAAMMQSSLQNALLLQMVQLGQFVPSLNNPSLPIQAAVRPLIPLAQTPTSSVLASATAQTLPVVNSATAQAPPIVASATAQAPPIVASATAQAPPIVASAAAPHIMKPLTQDSSVQALSYPSITSQALPFSLTASLQAPPSCIVPLTQPTSFCTPLTNVTTTLCGFHPSTPVQVAGTSSIFGAPVPSPGPIGSSTHDVQLSAVSNRLNTAKKYGNQAKEQSLIKRVPLTPSHAMHVLYHNGRALVLTAEVALWFGDHDHLKFKLQQCGLQPWAQLLTAGMVPNLCRQLHDTDVSYLVDHCKNKVMLYSLEDLPQIIRAVEGPEELLSAVKQEVEQWKSSRICYFQKSADIEELEAKINDLFVQRNTLVQELNQKSLRNEPLGDSLLQLTKIEENVHLMKNQITDTKKKSAIPNTSGVPRASTKDFALNCVQDLVTKPNECIQAIGPNKLVPAITSDQDPAVQCTSDSTPIYHQGPAVQLNFSPVFNSKERLPQKRLHGLGRGTPYVKQPMDTNKL